MSANLEGGPAHYRLSDETWAIILDEYRGGATVPELSERWRVSAHALRKRITRHKASKRDWGDRMAREQAGERARRQAQAREAHSETIARLFAPPADAGAEADGIEALTEKAMVASGRAMAGGLWAEAQALARLAEIYLRLADRPIRAGTFETTPLEVLFMARFDEEAMGRRFTLDPDRRDDPDYDLKIAYWRRDAEIATAFRERLNEQQREAIEARREAREAKAALAATKGG